MVQHTSSSIPPKNHFGAVEFDTQTEDSPCFLFFKQINDASCFLDDDYKTLLLKCVIIKIIRTIDIHLIISKPAFANRSYVHPG